MERKILFAVGEYYHIYNRGVEKRNIFTNDSDYKRFIKLLFVANGTKSFVYRDLKDKKLSEINRGEQLVAIGAYCQMPNHFHILVKEIKKGGISLFMEKFTTGYSKYFNKKYDRVGVLFQDRFKAQHVDRDEYLKYLFAYIHLNPIKIIESKWKEKKIKNIKKAEQFLQNYKYSSFLDYMGVQREENKILSLEEFPKYFLSTHEFQDFINDWIELGAEKEK